MSTVTVTATDPAGNRASASASFTVDTSTLPLVTAVPAASVRACLGVRTFPHYGSATDGQLPAVRQRIAELGVRWTSCALLPNLTAAVVAHMKMLGQSGCKLVFTVGQPFTTYSKAEWQTMEATVRSLSPYVEMLNGQNEINHVRGGGSLPANWAQQAANHQAIAFAMGRRCGVRVGSPSQWSGDVTIHDADLVTFSKVVVDVVDPVTGARLTGPVFTFFDDTTWHLYPRGVDPSWNLDRFVTEFDTAYGPRPKWGTEAGYGTAPNAPAGGGVMITEPTRAVYVRKMVAEYASRGMRVSYFQLLNDPDPAGSNREAWLGLYWTGAVDPSTWSATPAAQAVTSLQASLASLGDGTPPPLPLAVTAPPGVQQMLVGGTAGYQLWLWRRVDVEANKQPRVVAPVNVTVTDSSGTRTVPVTGDLVRVGVS